MPLCKKYALKRTTPLIAADRCRLLVRTCKFIPIQRIAQQQRKQKHRKTSLPQSIPAHLNNRRTTKKCTPYRTSPTPRTSAERGQENEQRHYRAPSRTMFYPPAQQNRETATPKSATQAPLFLLHRARRSSFSPHTEKKKRGVHPNKGIIYIPKEREPQPRAPAAAAAFRSATARRAALSAQMRVSFSPAGRKRNGGRIPRFLERKDPNRPRMGRKPNPPTGEPFRFLKENPPAPRRGAIPVSPKGKRQKYPRPERAQLKTPAPGRAQKNLFSFKEESIP